MHGKVCAKNTNPCQSATNKVVQIITVPGLKPKGVAFDYQNGDICVANSGSNSVSVINGATDQIIGRRRMVATTLQALLLTQLTITSTKVTPVCGTF